MEGIFLKIVVNKGLGRLKLSEVKEEELILNRLIVFLKGIVEGKLKVNLEIVRIRELEKDKV